MYITNNKKSVDIFTVVVYKVSENHTQVKVQIPYQKITLVEVEVTV